MRVQLRCQPALQSSEDLPGLEDFTSKLITWLLTRALSSFPHGFLHRVVHNMEAGFSELMICERERQRETKMDSAL